MTLGLNPIYLEVCVVVLGIVLLMAEAFLPGLKKSTIAVAGILGLAVVFGFSFFATGEAIPETARYASYYSGDTLAIFFKQFALVTTILVLIMSLEFAVVLEKGIPGNGRGSGVGEFFALPVLTCAGLMWMASATDFVTIFVSLELVTISFYVLVTYMRRNKACLEAGTKYLILGALSTGFLVYGIAWIFGATGQTNLARIAAFLPEMPAASQTSLLFGIALVLVGLGFKVAAVPFQFWVPDVYQGAPTPVTAFLSVGSKAAGFVVLLRVLQTFFVVPELEEKIVAAVAVMAGATLIFGNLAALPQTNMKRLMAYSSIGHAGYLLMGVAGIGAVLAGPAIAYYLVAYLVTTCLAFLILILTTRAIGSDDIASFNGLARRSPYLAGTLMLSMLSLAGIPFTAGFLGKFLIFETALVSGHFWLVGIGVLTVACGFYFYLKVVRAMYWQPAAKDAPEIPVSVLSKATIGVLSVLIFVLGVFPQPILELFAK